MQSWALEQVAESCVRVAGKREMQTLQSNTCIKTVMWNFWSSKLVQAGSVIQVAVQVADMKRLMSHHVCDGCRF